MTAKGFLHAENLLTDLGAVRTASAEGDGAVISEWSLGRGRIVVSQGADGRLRLYTGMAEADRSRPDPVLDRIAQISQSPPFSSRVN